MHQLPLAATWCPVPACLDTRLASHVDGAVEAAVVVSAEDGDSCRQCRLPPSRGKQRDYDDEEEEEEEGEEDHLPAQDLDLSLYTVRDARMCLSLQRLQRPQRPQRG